MINKQTNKIVTVSGLISKEELGYCQCHEHLFIKKGRSAEINGALQIDDYKLTVSELHSYKNNGGKSIVDAQPLGCGRMAKNLLKASKETGINIIASTGFHKLEFYPERHWIFTISEDAFANLLIKDLENGMFTDADQGWPSSNISARAGIIKIAFEKNSSSNNYKKLVIAAAKASLKTGATIMCHTEKGEGAFEVIELLRSYNVIPENIIICHLDRRVDNLDYHYKIAETGVFLDYDTIGRFKYHSDKNEVKLIEKMIEKGYEDKLLLALDTTRNRHKSYGGDIGLSYLINNFIPLLKKNGIDNLKINKFTITNPAEALIRRQ